MGFFAKSQPTRALFERSELCRSVGGSAFCKKSVNGILLFRTSIFLCVFMNTRYISVIQLKISKHFSFLYTYHDSIKEEKENRNESMLL